MSSTTWQFHNLLSMQALSRPLARRVEAWALKRQGSDAGVAVLQSRRVYILPTGVGMIYALMTFAMLLGSMNYNNNLSFVLTFLLASIGLVAMHQCQRNLVGLEVAFAGVAPVFAGQTAEFRIAINNHSRNYRYNLQIYTGAIESRVGNLAPGESRVFHLELPTSRRGFVRLPRFGIRTLFPFELFRAWAWLHMDLSGLVYPHASDHAPLPPPTQSAHGHRQHDARGEEDFAGLRAFQQGDSPRHVAWKAYARSGDMLSKLFSGSDTSSLWLDISNIAAADLEARLSILTRWILDADRAGQDYGVRIGGKEFPPAHGKAQRHACLKYFATYGLADEVPDSRS